MITLRGEAVAIVKLCFLPSTRLLAAGDEAGTVVGWELDAGPSHSPGGPRFGYPWNC